MAGDWLVRLANFENVKHCVVVEFHICVGESYYCSCCAHLVREPSLFLSRAAKSEAARSMGEGGGSGLPLSSYSTWGWLPVTSL